PLRMFFPPSSLSTFSNSPSTWLCSSLVTTVAGVMMRSAIATCSPFFSTVSSATGEEQRNPMDIRLTAFLTSESNCGSTGSSTSTSLSCTISSSSSTGPGGGEEDCTRVSVIERVGDGVRRRGVSAGGGGG